MKIFKLLLISLSIILFISCVKDKSIEPSTKAVIYGLVKDANTEKVLENVTVSIVEKSKNTSTDSDGLYRFSELESDVDYTLTATKTGYETSTETVSAVAGDEIKKILT